jgi:hypothetical protein
MATEVKLRPGWLMRDVQRAAQRLEEWSKSENLRSPAKKLAEKKRIQRAAVYQDFSRPNRDRC